MAGHLPDGAAVLSFGAVHLAEPCAEGNEQVPRRPFLAAWHSLSFRRARVDAALALSGLSRDGDRSESLGLRPSSLRAAVLGQRSDVVPMATARPDDHCRSAASFCTTLY